VTGNPVLIAAYSGRALAQSARRAGFTPLVADAFGDLDMQAAAENFSVIENAVSSGFRAKALIAALDKLVATLLRKPIGLVLGSGLEDKPRLVEILTRRYGLIGCSSETLRACKDPRVFFAVLDDIGIAHPEVSFAPPGNPEHWLSKRIGGSGGRHIRYCTASSRAKPRRYFQRRIEGERISVHAVVANDGISTAFSRQWTSPSADQPYRYGGAVSLADDAVAGAAQMLAIVDQLARAFELRGLVSFDFIVESGRPSLLEINPRAGATVDVFDDAHGSLFAAHVSASRDAPIDRSGGDLDHARAAAILHADRGAIELRHYDWPSWAADRGAPGTVVPRGAPLATVIADAETPDAAVALAHARLAELETLLYESIKT
jgi:uncharacterized protein